MTTTTTSPSLDLIRGSRPDALLAVAPMWPTTLSQPRGSTSASSVTLVTDGIDSAIAEAKAAAGVKDAIVIGGASTAQQCHRAGLLDELHIGIVPMPLGEGFRSFEYLAPCR